MGDHHHRSSSEEISCSICFELIHADGVRSVANLKCGHEFHLDCIGSEYNMKGKMQCPNCLEVESGDWLFANGPTSSPPEPSVEDWLNVGETFDFLDNDMEPSYIWCIYENASRVQPSYEHAPPGTEYISPGIYDYPHFCHRDNTRVEAVHDHHHHHHHLQHQPWHWYDHHRHHQQQQYGMPSPDVPSPSWLFNTCLSSPETPHDQASTSSANSRCWWEHEPIVPTSRDSIWGPPVRHRYGGGVQDSSEVWTDPHVVPSV